MNHVGISGRIAEQPVYRLEGGTTPHLILALRVGHRTRAGERRAEDYRVNAWNRVAQWGAENLAQGQLIALQGYLTQNAALGNAAEITAAEFMLLSAAKPMAEANTGETAAGPAVEANAETAVTATAEAGAEASGEASIPANNSKGVVEEADEPIDETAF